MTDTAKMSPRAHKLLLRLNGHCGKLQRAVERDERDEIAVYAMHAMVDIVHLGDEYDVNVFQHTFEKLKSLDRRDANAST